MKISQKLLKENSDLRNRIIAEIMLLVKKITIDLELAIEFDKPIFYGVGYDEQDNAPEIQEITEAGQALIYYQGNLEESIKLEQINTEKLIEVLAGLEESFISGEKFIKS